MAAPKKADYAAALLDWVARATNGVDSLQVPPVYPYATEHFHPLVDPSAQQDPYQNSVFSGAVLEAIRNDIRRTTLPSWLQKPPSNLGSSKHGKLKADHWRIACTVNMTITLGRLWSEATATADERLALDNFMHLVAAVDLATRRTMFAERAQAFDQHMLEYLRGIRQLYQAELVANHHLSLHLVDCLLLFGPTLAWWAFPFERYNGLLQRLNTNSRPADLPLTFMRYFYMGSKLRSMINTEAHSWPDLPEFKSLLHAFRTTIQDAARGSRIIESTFFSTVDSEPSEGSGKEESLDPPLYAILLDCVNSRVDPSRSTYASHFDAMDDNRPILSATAVFLPNIKHDGVLISESAHGVGNACVLFRRAGSNGQGYIGAGQVARIFQHTRNDSTGSSKTETFLLVKEYKPLSLAHQAFDPYRRFPDIDTWLCYEETYESQLLVPLEHFVSHFASYTYTPSDVKAPCIVVRSLDRT
ncbi:hypothetical protein NUW54_g11779 [Trametes sanguinea]|uniref:Uncharacterized protein n=1 Tax=Trametes sanguinea TaxID=158606 RepID=A0ACC1N773_9APHY|nr:hypothetical protein NUW54_g11779 [Trametes sanguinea]